MRLIDPKMSIDTIKSYIEVWDCHGCLPDGGTQHNVMAVDDLQYLPTIEAEPVDRWIPVEDALPEIGYSVWVTRITNSGFKYMRLATYQGDCWMDNYDNYENPNPDTVMAWMPMPDAYEPPEKE